MTTRAVAYYRASTDQQEGSVPAQRTWAAAAAAREGVRLAAEFEDDGVSGGLVDQRPGLQSLLAYCEKQFRDGTPVEAVLCWAADRLSRATSIKTSAVISRLQDAGVSRLFTAEDGWLDFDDVTSRVLYMIRQDLARSGYCESLARNTLRGQVAKAQKGLWVCGMPPFGYRVEAGRLVPDGGAAEAVRWIFAAYASGRYSLNDLADELARRGLVPVRESRRRANGEAPRRVGWRKNALGHLLVNKTYLGQTSWNLRHKGRYARLDGGGVVRKDDTARAREQDRRRHGRRHPAVTTNDPAAVVTVPNTHPPLTDEATFAAVAARLAKNRSRTTPFRGGGVWVLSGLARCGACGSPMHGETGKLGGGQVARYYVCSRARGQRRAGICWAVKLVEQDALVGAVVAVLRERFADGPALEALRAEVGRLAGEGAEGLRAERTRLRGVLAALETRLRQGEENLALCGDPEDFRAVSGQLRAWRQEREKAAAELERLGAAAEAQDGLAEKVEEAVAGLRDLANVIREAAPGEVRSALAGVVSGVSVHLRKAERTRDMRLDAIDVELTPGLVKLFTPGTGRGLR